MYYTKIYIVHLRTSRVLVQYHAIIHFANEVVKQQGRKTNATLDRVETELARIYIWGDARV